MEEKTEKQIEEIKQNIEEIRKEEEAKSELGMKPKKKTGVKALIFVIIGLMIFIAGCLAVFVYRKYGFHGGGLAENIEPSSTPNPQAQTENGEDEFEGWETYRSDEYGFEFQYPRDLNIKSTSASNAGKETTINQRNFYIYNPQDDEPYLDRYINFEVFDLEPTINNGNNYEEVIINGIDLKKYSFDEALFDIYHVNLTDKKVLEIYVLKNSDIIKVFDQILSTFKFVDEEDEWLSYEFEGITEYPSWTGFKLWYPKQWHITTEEGDVPKRMTLTLSKGENQIRISQSPGSRGGCLFPEDPEIDGFYSRYGEYKEILKNNETWRVSSTISDTNNHLTVCGDTGSDNFNAVTKIGWISVDYSEKNILDEIYEILERIEIID